MSSFYDYPILISQQNKNYVHYVKFCFISIILKISIKY